MFAVFADDTCTAKIYTHKFNITCMQDVEMLLAIPRKLNLRIPFQWSFRENLYPRNIPAIR